MDTVIVNCPYCGKMNMLKKIGGFNPITFAECQSCGELFPVKIEKIVKLKGTAYKNYSDIPSENEGYSITERMGDIFDN